MPRKKMTRTAPASSARFTEAEARRSDKPAAMPMPAQSSQSAWGNHHVAFAMAMLAAAVSIVYLTASTPEPASADTPPPAGPVCSVASFTVSEPCGPENIQNASATCVKRKTVTLGKGICKTKKDWGDIVKTACRQFGGVKTINYGEPCALQQYRRADVACTAPEGDTATATAFIGCRTSAQHQTAANQFCGSLSCAPIPAGSVTISVDEDSYPGDNYLMGSVAQRIARFKLTAGTEEPVTIHELTLKVNITPGQQTNFFSGEQNLLKNIQLIDLDTGLLLGATAPSLTDFVQREGYIEGNATFSGFSTMIQNGESRRVSVKTDFSTYQDGGFSSTGQVFTPRIVSALARGRVSGADLPIRFEADRAEAPSGSVYRAKLVTRWSPDTPAGAAAPSSEQTIAKFTITNLANAGNYVGTVRLINLNFWTTISPPGGTTNTRAMTIYKDSMSTTPLATTNFAVGQRFDGTGPIGASADTATRITETEFRDIDIASGTSKTFLVTLNTTDATTNNSLSLRIPANAILWTDSIATNITAMGQDLPLSYKTLTY